MKLFTLLQTKYDELDKAVKEYLTKTLGEHGTTYSNSTVFGQIINVLNSVVQNILLYLEDALTEQNKHTAQRKKSIYGLAVQSGYEPSLGKATTCNVCLNFIPNNIGDVSVIIPNKTKLMCSQNNLTYNIILPQEAITLSTTIDMSFKYLQIVEGTYETQTFVATGGQLYTINVPFTGDMDVDFLEVYVNNKLWSRAASLYDMNPDGEQFVVKPSLTNGVDILFGNDQFGRSLADSDEVTVTYLLHSGEQGNIDTNSDCSFTFEDEILTIGDENVNANEIFAISLASEDPISGGTYSETTDQVRELIGYNSRSFVLANAKNYENLIKKFSFCGYSRTWSEKGSLIVNSIILKNYQKHLKNGKDYFSLKDEDFFLTKSQRDSIQTHIKNSGQQLAGVTYNIYNPELCKYACYMYIKMKDVPYDRLSVENQIHDLVGNFMTNVQSDLFIPKSDLIQLIKNNIDTIDSVDIYFLSERNETAIKNRYYVITKNTYNPTKGIYEQKQEIVYLDPNEDPGLGLDEHGNILLDDYNQFPVLIGGWNFRSSDDFTNNSDQYTQIIDPLVVVFR